MSKEMTLSELVKQVLELQNRVPADSIVVVDSQNTDDPTALMHFDAVIEILPVQVERNPDATANGQYKETIVMATGTTASGDICPAVRLSMARLQRCK